MDCAQLLTSPVRADTRLDSRSQYDDSRSHWYLATLRDLSHNGLYDGLDSLFSENTPSCPACGQSLGPEYVTRREHRIFKDTREGQEIARRI